MINLKDLNIILYDKVSIDKYPHYSKFFRNIYAVNRDYKVLQLYEAFVSKNVNIDAIIYQVNDDDIINFDAFINPIRNINEYIPIILNFNNENILKILKSFSSNLTICYNPTLSDEILFKKISICIKHNKKFESIHHKIIENEKHLDIFNNVTLVSITDTNGIITYVNNKFCEETGFTKDELIGNTHNIHKHPEIRADFYKDMWNTIKKGSVWQGNFKNLNKLGNTYWVKSTIFPIVDKDNKISEFMCIRFLTTEEELLKKDSRKKTLNTLINNKKTIHQLKSKIRELENNYNINPYIKQLQNEISTLKKELHISKNNESNSVDTTISKFRKIQTELHNAFNKIKLKDKVIDNLKSDINKRDETIASQLSKLNQYSVQVRDLTVQLNNAESSLIILKRDRDKKKSRFNIIS